MQKNFGMDNLEVPIFVESRYRVNRKRIKAMVSKVLAKHQIKSAVEVSVAVVGDRKMKKLSKKYKGEDKTRNVLSFPLSEGSPTYLPSDKLRLGDIVISYPQVIKEAAQDEMLVDDKVDELIEHSMQHLLGTNHE